MKKRILFVDDEPNILQEVDVSVMIDETLGLWGLPESMVKAVALHHSPSDRLCEAFSAVYAANLFAHQLMASKDEPAAGTLESDDLGDFDRRLPAWREFCVKRIETGVR